MKEAMFGMDDFINSSCGHCSACLEAVFSGRSQLRPPKNALILSPKNSLF